MAELPSSSRRRRATDAQDRPTPRTEELRPDRAVTVRLRAAVRGAGGNSAVAHRSGVPLATVNNYVRGRNGMKIDALSALAGACNVSLDWLAAGNEAAAPRSSSGRDFPDAKAAPPPGLGEAPAPPPTVGLNEGIDVRALTKAIEIVAALAGAAGFQDDPKELAHRIATTYAVLMEPDASRE